MMRQGWMMALAALLGGCVTAAGLPEDTASALLAQDRMSIAAGESEIAGVWRARGYGWIVEIGPAGQRLYETGGFGCYARPAGVAGLTPMLSLSFADYRLAPDGKTAMLHYGPDQVGPVFDRLPALPEACTASPDTQPAAVLDAFIDMMDSHYAHFERRGAEREALFAQARAILAEDRTEQGLKAAMRAVIEPLGDSHTRVIIPLEDGKKRIGSGLGPTLTRLRAQEAETPWLIGIIDGLTGEVLDPGARHVGRERILWGTIGGRVGYLQIFQMGGFAGLDIADPAWAETELSVMESLLDEAFAHFGAQGVKGVILDLSNNRGGYDEVSRRLAARFAEGPFHAYSVSARGSGLAPLRKIVTPQAEKRFLGPVYVLTSDVTVSGGEIATLALRQLPHVTQAGQATRGAFSTPLSKALPNGWVLELANETFAAPDGSVYAGGGIPPHIPLKVFAPEDPVASHAEAVRALAAMVAAQ